MTRPRTRARSAGVALFVLQRDLCSLPLSGPAQAHPEHSYDVAMVLPRPEGEVERAFEKYFAKLSIALHVDVIFYSGRPADQPALLAQLRRLAPDLIYTWDTPHHTGRGRPRRRRPGAVRSQYPGGVYLGLRSDCRGPGQQSRAPGTQRNRRHSARPAAHSAQSDRCLPSLSHPGISL